MRNDSLFKGYSGHCQWDGKIKQGKGQWLPPSASSLAELTQHTSPCNTRQMHISLRLSWCCFIWICTLNKLHSKSETLRLDWFTGSIGECLQQDLVFFGKKRKVKLNTSTTISVLRAEYFLLPYLTIIQKCPRYNKALKTRIYNMACSSIIVL